MGRRVAARSPLDPVDAALAHSKRMIPMMLAGKVRAFRDQIKDVGRDAWQRSSFRHSGGGAVYGHSRRVADM